LSEKELCAIVMAEMVARTELLGPAEVGNVALLEHHLDGVGCTGERGTSTNTRVRKTSGY